MNGPAATSGRPIPVFLMTPGAVISLTVGAFDSLSNLLLKSGNLHNLNKLVLTQKPGNRRNRNRSGSLLAKVQAKAQGLARKHHKTKECCECTRGGQQGCAGHWALPPPCA